MLYIYREWVLILIINYIKNLTTNDKVVEIIEFNENNVLPEATVIIVTYNTDKKLLSQNLDSLKKQLNNKFEIIIIDNSDKTDIKSIVSSYSLKYIKLNKNYGLCVARNIGIKFAIGNIVIFLDDDAIPTQNFVKEHIRAHKECNIIGLRGKALPRTKNNIYNYFAYHYNYGDKSIPCYINLEGNSSFEKKELLEIGGFNPKLKGAGGYEGLELTYRIINKYKNKNLLIYYPQAVIYHDYSNTLKKFLIKRLRHRKHSKLIKGEYNKIFKLKESYSLNPICSEFWDKNLINDIRLRFLKYICSFTKIN